MNEARIEEIISEIMKFKMPRYDKLPRMNLYLEQVIEEVVFILEPIFGNNEEKWITRTMVGNYVKQGLIPRPIGKKYSKEHIAYLVYFNCKAGAFHGRDQKTVRDPENFLSD